MNSCTRSRSSSSSSCAGGAKPVGCLAVERRARWCCSKGNETRGGIRGRERRRALWERRRRGFSSEAIVNCVEETRERERK